MQAVSKFCDIPKEIKLHICRFAGLETWEILSRVIPELETQIIVQYRKVINDPTYGDRADIILDSARLNCIELTKYLLTVNYRRRILLPDVCTMLERTENIELFHWAASLSDKKIMVSYMTVVNIINNNNVYAATKYIELCSKSKIEYSYSQNVYLELDKNCTKFDAFLLLWEHTDDPVWFHMLLRLLDKFNRVEDVKMIISRAVSLDRIYAENQQIINTGYKNYMYFNYTDHDGYVEMHYTRLLHFKNKDILNVVLNNIRFEHYVVTEITAHPNSEKGMQILEWAIKTDQLQVSDAISLMECQRQQRYWFVAGYNYPIYKIMKNFKHRDSQEFTEYLTNTVKKQNIIHNPRSLLTENELKKYIIPMLEAGYTAMAYVNGADITMIKRYAPKVSDNFIKEIHKCENKKNK